MSGGLVLEALRAKIETLIQPETQSPWPLRVVPPEAGVGRAKGGPRGTSKRYGDQSLLADEVSSEPLGPEGLEGHRITLSLLSRFESATEARQRADALSAALEAVPLSVPGLRVVQSGPVFRDVLRTPVPHQWRATIRWKVVTEPLAAPEGEG
ncbi:MAG: DUF3168 domain-containing protein [Asticcacaulis sp.]